MLEIELNPLDATPEASLWAAVLSTYIDDARILVRKPNPSRDRAEALLTGVRSEWSKYVCSMINVSHSALVGKVEGILRSAVG